MGNFVHLHNHTHYSLLRSLITPGQLVKHAKEMGHTAVAMTDTNAIYGGIELYQAAKKEGIKPIIGVEIDIVIKASKGNEAKGHIVLLAENQEGYEKLLHLVTLAHAHSEDYGSPAVSWKELLDNFVGIIALTGSTEGLFGQLLRDGKKERAVKLMQELEEKRRDCLYLELQHHPKKVGQNELNKALIEIASENTLPLVAANDIHYLDKKDADAQDIMFCISQNATKDEEDRNSMKGVDYSFVEDKKMIEYFSDHPEAIENTVRIADRCEVEFTFGEYLIPPFPIPDKQSANEYMTKLCLEGLEHRYGTKIDYEAFSKKDYSKLSEEDQERAERLHYEIDIIHNMGFETYFLIVWDFVKYAKDTGILVGPGRGSAAGSIVSYCLGITDLDPLKYGLLFERFLNPERVEMPDIDMDFEDIRRDEVLDYVVQKYGKDRVAQISTYGTLAARAAVKDVGRAMGIPFLEMNNLAKQIPARPGVKLQELLEDKNSDLSMARKSAPLYKDIIDYALKVEGLVRHVSVHACAVVITPEPLEKYTALQPAPKDSSSIITQYSAKPLGSLGLLKMDFLGLRNLTIIHKALDLIKKRHNEEIILSEIPLDDGKTFEVFGKGETTGVFQFESGGMRRYLKELIPTEIEDIIAMAALYRPGPMEWIPHYIKGKHKEIEVQYVHPSLKPYLESTYGVAVYQEQVMQIAQEFSGMPLGQAYILLKGIAKKVPKIVQENKEKFITGAVKKKGHSKELALDIFEKVIEPFAGYGFNKSHAACYAYIAYQTAYLKANYPTEFMTALMSSDADDTDRLKLEIDECNSNGIAVLKPDVNSSEMLFSIEDEHTIRFGLSGIKGLGSNTIDKIIEERAKAPFKDLNDFLNRLDTKVLNKKSFEALIKSGTLDNFGERKTLLENIPEMQSFLKKKDSQNSGIPEEQASLFELSEEAMAPKEESLDLKPTLPASDMQKLSWEKELLGVYLSSHPLEGLGDYLQHKNTLIKDIDKKAVGRTVTVGGIIITSKNFRTRKGDTMGVFQLEDVTDKMEITLFPETFQNYRNQWKEGDIVFVRGKVSFRNNDFQIIANKIEVKEHSDLKKAAARLAKKKADEKPSTKAPESEENTEEYMVYKQENDTCFFKLPKNISKSDLLELKEIIKRHPGKTHVELCYPDKSCIPIPYKITMGPELTADVKKWKDSKTSMVTS